MTRIITFFLFMFLWNPIQAKIPLQTAIEQGIQINLKIKNQSLEEKIKNSERAIARKNRFFNLNLGGSYLYKSQQIQIEFPAADLGGGISIPGQEIVAGAKHNFDSSFSIIQPLYWGRILFNQLKLKDTEKVYAEWITQAEILDVASRIKSVYFSYHLLNKKKMALQTLIKKLGLHRQKLFDYFNEDLIRKSDLLETDSKIQEQLLILEDINNLIDHEKITFRTLCGLEINIISETYRENIVGLTEVLALFKKKNPFLQSLLQKKRTFNLQQKIINGKYLPQVTAFAELHFAKPGIDFFQNRWSFYFLGGISLSLKLFDWNQKKDSDEIFLYTAEKLNNSINDFILNSEKILKQLYLKKESAEAKLNTLNQLIHISTEDNLLKEELLEQQQIANIDFLASLTTKEQYLAKRDEILTQIELIKVNINKTIGLPMGYKKENR